MEYTCLVLDVGRHMLNDTQNTVPDTSAFKAVESLIHKKLFSESKDEMALIYCGTSDTNNSVYDEDSKSFKNITVVWELKKIDWDLLKKLNLDISYCKKNESDLLEAIYVAADHLVNKLKGRKIIGKKRIIVFSNLECEIDLSQVESIESGLKSEMIELSIVSNRDLSESHVHCPEQDCHQISQTQLKNEQNLLKLVQGTNGISLTFKNALMDLNLFQNKSVTQRGWKVNLEISDVFSLSVVGYLKVKQTKLPSLKKIDFNSDNPDEIPVGSGDVSTDADKGSVSTDTATETNDTIRGYRYGKSIVPWTQEDTESMKLQVEKGMKLIGFTEEENVPKNLMVGDSATVFVVEDESQSAAFTSLVDAMYASQVVALVRKVYSKASSPKLGALIPRIKADHVSLVYVELAFGEDIRRFTFPNLPIDDSFTGEEIEAIDDLIDSMMLVEEGPDNEQTEILKPSHVRNPTIQYFYQCAQFRCFHPDEPLPDPSPEILKLLEPPFEKIRDIGDVIKTIKNKFPLIEKTVVSHTKKAASKSFPEDDEPIKKIRLDQESGKCLDLGEILEKPVLEVGSVDPIGDCRQLLRRGNDLEAAVRGLGERVWQLVNDSYMDTSFPRAAVCLHAMRTFSIEYSSTKADLVSLFNSFLIDMKSRLLITPAKKQFWASIRHGDINLVSKHESPFSTIPDEQVDAFLVDEPSPQPLVTMEIDDELDSLFDDM